MRLDERFGLRHALDHHTAVLHHLDDVHLLQQRAGAPDGLRRYAVLTTHQGTSGELPPFNEIPLDNPAGDVDRYAFVDGTTLLARAAVWFEITALVCLPVHVP